MSLLRNILEVCFTTLTICLDYGEIFRCSGVIEGNGDSFTVDTDDQIKLGYRQYKAPLKETSVLISIAGAVLFFVMVFADMYRWKKNEKIC